MRRRILRLIVLAVVVPLGSHLAIRLADSLERRNGVTRMTRAIRAGGQLAARRGR